MAIYTLIFSFCAILSAGIIRGYSGFGFSMIAVVSLSLVMPPAEIMIAMLDLERVTQVREYGTCGVSRALSSYFHESHRFDHQRAGYKESPAGKSIPGFPDGKQER